MTNPGQESPDNEAIRELRDATKELDKSTERHSKILEKLSIVLLVVALTQLIVTVLLSTNPLVEKLGALGFVVLSIVWGVSYFKNL